MQPKALLIALKPEVYRHQTAHQQQHGVAKDINRINSPNAALCLLSSPFTFACFEEGGGFSYNSYYWFLQALICFDE